MVWLQINLRNRRFTLIVWTIGAIFISFKIVWGLYGNSFIILTCPCAVPYHNILWSNPILFCMHNYYAVFGTLSTHLIPFAIWATAGRRLSLYFSPVSAAQFLMLSSQCSIMRVLLINLIHVQVKISC